MTTAIPSVMKGLIFAEKGRTVLQQNSAPALQDGAVLCRTLYTGLTNGTERNVLMGGNYGGRWPSRCGYQNVGRVLAVGAGVQGFAPGDVVFSARLPPPRGVLAAPSGPDSSC